MMMRLAQCRSRLPKRTLDYFDMAKPRKKRSAPAGQSGTSKGWKEIGGVLGASASSCAAMGIRGNAAATTRQTRDYDAEELNNWVGKQSGKPVHVATESTDLSAELKRGLDHQPMAA